MPVVGSPLSDYLAFAPHMKMLPDTYADPGQAWEAGRAAIAGGERPSVAILVGNGTSIILDAEDLQP